MPADAMDFRTRFESLRPRCDALGRRLIEVADAFATTGVPPSDELLDQLLQLRHEFLGIRSGIDEGESDDELTLDSLRELVDQHEWAQCRRDADRVLLAIVGLRHVDGEFEPLAELQAAAEQLRGLTESTEENKARLQEIVEEDHPWHALVQLVQYGDTLTDDVWDRCHARIQETWGKSMSSAAARGKLRITNIEGLPASSRAGSNGRADSEPCVLDDLIDECDFDSKTAQDRTLEMRAAAAAALEAARQEAVDEGDASPADANEALVVDVDGDSKNGDAADESQPSAQRDDPQPASTDRSSIFDDDLPEAPRRQGSQPPRDQVSVVNDFSESTSTSAQELVFGDDDPIEESEALDSSILKESIFVDPEGPVAELARQALQADGGERTALIADLILYLVYEGRSGLAFQLAKCLEQQESAASSFLPSWLIRAWALGLAVQFPNGRLAGQLQEDFERYSPRMLECHDRNWSTALGYFVRAAALRPTLVAPATQAGSLLRSFEMQTESIRLYNYCSRIATYGERIGGIAPMELVTCDQVSRQSQIAQLQEEVAQWRNRVAEHHCRYIVVAPLYQRAHWSLKSGGMSRHPQEAINWQQWQQMFLAAQPILRLIEDNIAGNHVSMRSELEQLAHRIPETRPAGRASGPLRDVQEALREVLTFGERWLALSSVPQEEFVSQDLDELRKELDERQEPVFEELEFIAECHQSLEIRIGLACLMLALQQVKDVVLPDGSASIKEPDPRHLLHGELLKIPSLPLDSQWEPAADPECVEHELLQYLSSPQPDWATAFQLQAGHQHHDATQRIASLDVWTNAERATLLALRDRQLRQSREELLTDLEATERMIEDAAREELFSQHDRVGFDARLKRLRQHLMHNTELSGSASEMQRLRTAVERRRSQESQLSANGLSPSLTSDSPGWRTHFFADGRE